MKVRTVTYERLSNVALPRYNNETVSVTVELADKETARAALARAKKEVEDFIIAGIIERQKGRDAAEARTARASAKRRLDGSGSSDFI